MCFCFLLACRAYRRGTPTSSGTWYKKQPCECAHTTRIYLPHGKQQRLESNSLVTTVHGGGVVAGGQWFAARTPPSLPGRCFHPPPPLYGLTTTAMHVHGNKYPPFDLIPSLNTRTPAIPTKPVPNVREPFVCSFFLVSVLTRPLDDHYH